MSCFERLRCFERLSARGGGVLPTATVRRRPTPKPGRCYRPRRACGRGRLCLTTRGNEKVAARDQQRSDQPHEWDRCETVPVDEERERPHDPGRPSGEGAPPGDPDYHLHTELGEETKRLATHPREEAHRLADELREGETETTPLIAIGGLALWLGVLVAIVIALVFLIARLAS
jgi:hypothetical protein